MTNGNKYTSFYLKALFNLKREMLNKTHTERDHLWLNAFGELDVNSINNDTLPLVLSLIHPDFYYRRGESFQDNLNWKKKSDFTAGIRNTSICSISKLTKIDCLFNDIPEIRGKVEADHIWPNSLGGPSILDNRLLLCRFHNGMKSNDISNFTWDTEPSWLKKYLYEIYYLKQ